MRIHLVFLLNFSKYVRNHKKLDNITKLIKFSKIYFGNNLHNLLGYVRQQKKKREFVLFFKLTCVGKFWCDVKVESSKKKLDTKPYLNSEHTEGQVMLRRS